MESKELKSVAEGYKETPSRSVPLAFKPMNSSESHLVKCDRISQKKKKKKKKQLVSREADALQGTSKQKLASGTLFRGQPLESQLVQCSRNYQMNKQQQQRVSRLVEIVESSLLEVAEIALEFYIKNQQGGEFEILKVVNASDSTLKLPGSERSRKLWVHMTFIAKSKNGDDSTAKHFFGELYKDDRSRKYYATYCSTYEPSDDPEFNHGCIFCPPGLKYHPADGFLVGRPPWYIQKFVFA